MKQLGGRWRSLVRLFERAAGLSSEEQQTLLEEACEGDEALQSELRSLLDADRSAEGLFETPALELEAQRLARNALGLAGSRFGEFHVESLIASGGSALVYRATDPARGRTVALKVFLGAQRLDRIARRRFKREIRAVAAIDDPRVPRCYAFGEERGVFYLAEEFVDGTTLERRMSEHDFDAAEILRLAAEVTEVLAVAHGRGVVHRDIKPSNLMITEDGQLKLLDFGIAKFLDSGMCLSQESIDETVTRSGTLIGTFDYMSPEQWMGRSVDPRSDIFSLGVVLFELATGWNPLRSAHPGRQIALRTDWTSPPVERLVPDLAPRLVRVINRCLKRRPEERYGSAEALLADLRAEGSPSE